MGGACDSDLSFFHRFQQGRLHLGRRAIDFIGQNDVGENRPRLKTKLAAAFGQAILNLSEIRIEVEPQPEGQKDDAQDAIKQAAE